MKYSDFHPKKMKRIPLYLIVGEEFLLRDEIIRSFRDCLGGNTLFFKESQTIAPEFSLEKLWGDVYSQPLFEEWNLIILRDAENAEKFDKKSKKDSSETKNKGKNKNKGITFCQQVEDYLTMSKEAELQTTLILELNIGEKEFGEAKKTSAKKTSTKKQDKVEEERPNRSWYDIVELYPNFVQVIECYTLKDEIPYWQKNKNAETELECWVRERSLGKYHKEISSDAKSELILRVGNSLGTLDSELKNLATFIKTRNQITLEDVKSLVKFTKKGETFRFWDMVLEGNVEEAYRLYYINFNQGITVGDKFEIRDEDVARDLLGACHSKLGNLWNALASKESGAYIHPKAREQAEHFTIGILAKIWNKLLEADISSKLSKAPNIAVLEIMQFILDIRKK